MAQLPHDGRTRRVMLGVCVDCGDEPARPGRLLGEACSLRHNAAAKARARGPSTRSRDHEKCGSCGEPGHDRRTCDLFGPKSREGALVRIAGSTCLCGRHKFSEKFQVWLAWGPLGRLPLKGKPPCIGATEERFLRVHPLPHPEGCICIVCGRGRNAARRGATS